MMSSRRAGSFVKQATGYSAFIPKPLPPDPPLKRDNDLMNLLSTASEKLGRLDGLAVNLPNPDLFVTMYVRKEALLSSQIEGTQASLDDVLTYDLRRHEEGVPFDVLEVVNYVNAMNYGLERVREFPLSLRLIKGIHSRLLRSVRGSEKTPGEFRKSQNWIGPPGCTISESLFVPPPHHEMITAMGELEKYLYKGKNVPSLIKASLVHAQFETIHPFLDGNGRMGRLLITFMLCIEGSLRRPLLYLSYFFKENRQAYYDRLNRIRTDGDWEGWIKFFLKGVAQVSDNAIETATKIISLRDNHIDLVRSSFARGSNNALNMLEFLYRNPYIDASSSGQYLEVSRPTVYSLIKKFVKLGILSEWKKTTRGKIFSYSSYLNILREGTQPKGRI